MTQKFCTNCGSILKEGARFCENCGTSVPPSFGERAAPSVQQQNTPPPGQNMPPRPAFGHVDKAGQYDNPGQTPYVGTMPMPPQKKPNVGLIIALAVVGLLAVSAIVTAVVIGLSGDDNTHTANQKEMLHPSEQTHTNEGQITDDGIDAYYGETTGEKEQTAETENQATITLLPENEPVMPNSNPYLEMPAFNVDDWLYQYDYVLRFDEDYGELVPITDPQAINGFWKCVGYYYDNDDNYTYVMELAAIDIEIGSAKSYAKLYPKAINYGEGYEPEEGEMYYEGYYEYVEEEDEYELFLDGKEHGYLNIYDLETNTIGATAIGYLSFENGYCFFDIFR